MKDLLFYILAYITLPPVWAIIGLLVSCFLTIIIVACVPNKFYGEHSISIVSLAYSAWFSVFLVWTFVLLPKTY
ncbi:hypothetical protein J4403_04240 [Candidatus Woesearchaeota archaeon]|nr:hypothetical protein [Candidatus Woesearchaeota archaeon]